MENKSIRQRILDMKVGDRLTFPVTEVGYTTIRAYSSDRGFAVSRRYTTHRNREERSYTIERLS